LIIFFNSEASHERIDFLFSPLKEVSNINCSQYAIPPKRPIPLKPLSTPLFLVDCAIFCNIG